MAATAAEQGELFERLTSWANLLSAARKTRRRKRRIPECARFELDRERELLRLQDELRARTYQPRGYRTFYVREPKRRMISAAPYRDRVVHHALVNVIGPLFERNFITDSYANRVGKGTHRAVDRYQCLARRFRYVLPCDIVRFFPSVDHEILKRLLRSRIHDPGVLWLCDRIIDAGNPQEPAAIHYPGDDLLTPLERRRGLPIGNMTSQFWANVYLHGLDTFVKRGLGLRGYVRYVDDFLLLSDEKTRLWEARAAVIDFLARLRLRIHLERAQPQPVSRPLRFLGYRCWPTHRFITKDNIRRFRKRARRLQELYADGVLAWNRVRERLAAWNAHAATANGWKLRHRVLGRLTFVRRRSVEMDACCAAGRGTTTRTTAAPRTATTTHRRTATPTTGSDVRPGLPQPLGSDCRPTTVAGSVSWESEPIACSSVACAWEANAGSDPAGPCRHCPGRDEHSRGGPTS